jgi:hypothetical protein
MISIARTDTAQMTAHGSENLLQGVNLSTASSYILAVSNWHEIVRQYTYRYFTYRKGKLPTLQRVNKSMSRQRRCTFYAGLWEDSMFFDLRWSSGDTGPGEHHEYRAHSWFWASAEGLVRWEFVSTRTNIKPLSYQARPSHVALIILARSPLALLD